MADRGVEYLEGAAARIAAFDDACTRCGACFEACPMPAAAGVASADGGVVVEGLLALLGDREGSSAENEAWTSACCGSGYCREACPEGVDVRFLQRMGKIAQLSRDGDPKTVKRRSVETYNAMAASVRAIGGLLAEADERAQVRNGLPANEAPENGPSDVVFYTGCNVWKTPHIVLTALDTLEALGVSATVIGGPSACCGVYGFNQGDGKVSGRQAFGAIEKLAGAGAKTALSWCPSCQIQIGDLALGNWEQSRGERPFDLNPFYKFLAERIDDLRPHLQPIERRRVALIERPAIPGAMDALRTILGAIDGVEIVDLDVRPAGVMENTLAVLKEFRNAQRAATLADAQAKSVDVLATVYHACHRELCRYDDGQPFEILNVMSLLAEALGRPREDRYKALKALGSVDAVIDAVAPDAAARGLDLAQLKAALAADMFAATPLATPPRT